MKSAFMVATVLVIGLSSAACKKNKTNCRCTYYGGNVSNYDLSNVDKAKRSDSCAHLSSLASNFAGSCKLN